MYYRQIVDLLSLKPEGLKVSTIAIHIYNQQGNLFTDEGLYQKIYESIRQFLWQQSKKRNSPFVTVDGKRGYYKLRPNFHYQAELMFEDDFQYDIVEPKKKKEQDPNQLTLF